MSKQEIYPPGTNLPAVRVTPSVSVPTVYKGDRVQSYFDRKRWESQSKALAAFADLNAREADVVNRQAELVRAAANKKTALAEYEELPEKLGHELQVRRIQRAEVVLRELHIVASNETRRETERTHLRVSLTNQQTELRHAQRGYLVADQEYRAQEKYGDGTAAIAHKVSRHKLLKLKLEEKAKRGILRKLEQGDELTEEEMLQALYRGDDEE